KPDVKGKAFGATLGGPIVANRTFFFVDYEGVRRPQDIPISQVVPPDAYRRGDLSSVGRPIINPATGQPFPNNQVPVNPVASRILNDLFEAQNQSTGASLAAPNFKENLASDFTVNAFDARLDQVLTPAQKVFARFTFRDLDNTGTDGTSGYNTKQGLYSSRTEVRNLAVTHNWILGPRMV